MNINEFIKKDFMQDAISAEVEANKVNKLIISSYLKYLDPKKLSLKNFMELIKLSIGFNYDFKRKILESCGLNKKELDAIDKAINEFESNLPDDSIYHDSTSQISRGALTALQLNQSKINDDINLSKFLKSFITLLQTLAIKTTLPVQEVRALYIKQLPADMFPIYINAKTLCAVLYSLRPDAFPLTNSYVLIQLKKFLGKFDDSPDDYIKIANVLDQILAKIHPDQHHFGVIDRLMAMSEEDLDLNINLTEFTQSIASDNSKMNINVPKNQILFGAAGTGKTYHTINKALEIIDPRFLKQNDNPHQRTLLKQRFDELVAQQQIRFVTFHQSFSYEDFIEGIRAETILSEEGNNTSQKIIHYPVVDGVFKQTCDLAKSITQSNVDEELNLTDRRIWKMSLGQAGIDEDIFEYCMTNNVVLLGWGEELDYTDCNDEAAVIKHMKANKLTKYLEENPASSRFINYFKNKIKIGDLIVVSQGNYKFRAIGEVTGDYGLMPDSDDVPRYIQKRPVRWLKYYNPSLPIEQLSDKELSMQTLYNLERSVNREKLKQLLQPSKHEESNQSKNFVLIIDEINRGNISRIFGELITLIEESKREGAEEGLSVVLPYSKTVFSVPNNVYIIGTMNSSDRSLTGLDIALRRRFTFIEMQPDPGQLAGISIDGVDIKALLTVINQRIEVLLDRDHCIGHAYFMPLRNQGKQTLRELGFIFKQKIIPLLQEYFYDDWERIDWVLGSNGMVTQQFSQTGDLEKLFPKAALDKVHNHCWQVNPIAQFDSDIRLYQKIINIRDAQ